MNYESICGCLVSGPEPQQCEFDDEARFEAAHGVWEKAWDARLDRHHPYCCELRQRGGFEVCLEGQEELCPQADTLARGVYDEWDHSDPEVLVTL